VWRNAPFFDPSVVVGAGDVISTAEDLWRFDQALYDDRLLSAPSRALLFAPTMPAKDNYALGWYVRLPAKHPGPDWARHSGSVNGFSAILLRLPEGRRTVVLLSNAHGVRTTAIGDAVKQVLYTGG
jgi:CubicO group peptidase (beta-lactamase class C family)